nr:hypothetical protein [Tanacetum cinerariifolium]
MLSRIHHLFKFELLWRKDDKALRHKGSDDSALSNLKIWSISSSSSMLSFLKRYSGIMFTHDVKSSKVSKGFESPNLQGRVNSPSSSIFADTSPWKNVDLFLPSSKLFTECSCHSIGDGLQYCVDFFGHLALLLFEIGFKLGQSSILRCHKVEYQSFEISLTVKILRMVAEGMVQDRTVRLQRRNVSFHQALDLIYELDEAAVGCTRDISRQRDFLDQIRFFGVSVTKLATGRLINGSSCDGIDMVIKDLDLEPKIYAIMRDFLEVLQSFLVEKIEQGNE